MKLTTMCDMGSIKIFNDTMSCFFMNNFGDGTNKVEIIKKTNKNTRDLEFKGHFTVKTRAYLSAYDCKDEPLYTFSKGRWFVYLKSPQSFLIQKMDNELHS